MNVYCVFLNSIYYSEEYFTKEKKGLSQHGWTSKMWMKPDTKKSYIIWLHLYEIFRVDIHRDRMQIGGCYRLGEGGSGEKLITGCKELYFEVMEMFWTRPRWWLWNRECTKCHWVIHFKIVNFMLCEFYLNKKLKHFWKLYIS